MSKAKGKGKKKGSAGIGPWILALLALTVVVWIAMPSDPACDAMFRERSAQSLGWGELTDVMMVCENEGIAAGRAALLRALAR